MILRPIDNTMKPLFFTGRNPAILAAKRAGPAADTTALEREIDRHVYALYGLTPDEIKLVEDSVDAK